MDMTTVDELLIKVRTSMNKRTDGVFSIKRDSLDLLVAEIDRLRAGLNAVSLPDRNRPGQYHAKASDTERNAAFAVMPRTGTQRIKVLRAIINSPDGLTDAEVSDQTGIYLYSAAPRRNELLIGGWVRDSGHTRATGNGGDGIVWVATDKAIAQRQRINN